MLYLCCIQAVDATVHAARLGYGLRQQHANFELIHHPRLVPMRCEALDIRATPEFWEVVSGDTPPRLTSARESQARRNIASRENARRNELLMVASLVEARGGKIKPPYDVPEALEPNAIERWLSD